MGVVFSMGEEGKTRGAPIFLIIIALAMLIIALVALFWEYVSHGALNPINMSLGIGTILLSIYFLLQSIKKPRNTFTETQKVSTVIRCMNCDYASAKEFEKGDFVFKEIGVCPRCGGNLIIYSIFREVKEKE